MDNFKFQLVQTEFDESGNYIGQGSEQFSAKNVTDANRPLKSSQVVIAEESAATEEDNAGHVMVESSPLHVTDSMEAATRDLKEQAKSKKKKELQGGIVEHHDSAPSRKQKPVTKDASKVITGDVFKSDKASLATSVVLDANHSPVPVGSVNENMKFASSDNPHPNTFVYDPPKSGQKDVVASPPVNYGGKSSKLEKTEMFTEASPEKVGENTMTQPAMAPVSDLSPEITIDTIVRNPSKTSALDAISKCRNYQTLKLAHKQLRQLGNKQDLEKAVQHRLLTVPPGSVG
jgi:hypothetical protein